MMKTRRSTNALSLGFLLLLIFVLLPFGLIVLNSFKTLLEIAQNILGLPASFSLNNYIRAWEILDYPRAFLNTLIVTILGNAGLIVFGTMTGYWLARHRTRLNRFLYVLFLAAMAIPFEACMIPIMRVTSVCHFNGSLVGLGICYWGLGASTVVFLTYGAVLNIPYELEESASIDGCGRLRLFWQIVFPLLKPIVITFTIMDTFWFWNDYLMPQLMLGRSSELYTLQLTMRSMFMEYFTMWDVALAGLVLILIPTIIFFLIAQKRIVEGLMSGSVKG